MPDLPAIVEAIRRQRPVVVPEWLKSWDYPDAFRNELTRQWLPDDGVEAMLVGWLFQKWARLYDADLDGSICNVYFSGAMGGAWVSSPMDGETNPTTFEPTTRGCILALCRAIGIEVGDA